MSRDPRRGLDPTEPPAELEAAADEVVVELVRKARGNDLGERVAADAARAAELVASGLARYVE